MPEGDEANAEDGEEKAVKKKKKDKKRKAADAAVEEEQEAEAEVETKKKKKKNSNKEESAPAEDDTQDVPKKKKKKKKQAAEEEVDEQPKKAKKKKKQEVEEADDSDEFLEIDCLADKEKNKGEGAKAIEGDGGFRKNFYKEHPKVTAMTDAEVEAHRKEWTMAVAGGSADFKPVPEFEWLDIDQNIMKITKKFQKPTAIQAQCWPVCLAGRDCIGVAETGSGKSLGFLLPAVVHIMDQPPLTQKANGPIALVIAPTRELALQTMEVAEECGRLCNLKQVCIFGGVPKGPQETALWKGVHTVVATPGRLKDLINQGSCNLDRITYAVLDEADRMLDQGFAPEIRYILGCTRKDRQTLMFTATWPMSVQQLAMEFLNDPVRVTIGSANLTTNARIKQTILVCAPREKEWKLQDLLKNIHKKNNKILLFALYKKEAARLEQTLQRRGYTVGSIHGDKSQVDRNKALEDFKNGTVPLLVATDVAARGLDIPNVEYVVNVTFPLTIEDYVHRIGRTGRGGKSGARWRTSLQPIWLSSRQLSPCGNLCGPPRRRCRTRARPFRSSTSRRRSTARCRVTLASIRSRSRTWSRCSGRVRRS